MLFDSSAAAHLMGLREERGTQYFVSDTFKPIFDDTPLNSTNSQIQR